MGYWPAVMQIIKNAEVIILVLDSRMPEISKNKQLDNKLKESKKRVLIVYNKTDLISERKLKKLKNENPSSFFVSAQSRKGIKNLRFELQKITKSLKTDELDVGIIGYPNVGKSALTNALARTSKAKVLSKAGTTKGPQWITGTKIKFLDSPGVIPFEDDEVKLGLLGAKNPEKLKDAEKVALKILDLFRNSAKNLCALYKISSDPKDDSYSNFTKIAESRKLLRKGGVIDEQRTALMIIKDWQTGKLLLG
jgi:ribosome biogenesis GTPase A